MFIFGHMGIGTELVKPWNRGLALKWILLGTLLPDMLDKPLYYGMVALTGRHGADLGLISGTRTFGHSALFLLVLLFFSWRTNSKKLAAICLGVASHLVLDNLGDAFLGSQIHTGPTTAWALLFPLLGPHFPIMPYGTVGEHLHSVTAPFYIGAEIVGAALLGWTYWKRQHYREILGDMHKKRIRFRSFKLRKKRAKPV